MRIDSGLSGSYYQSRLYEIDREAEDAPVSAAVLPTRSANAITGSSTVASSSLANAFWVVDGGKKAGAGETASRDLVAAARTEWVNDLYLEYSESA
jgi:hypothetical protein